MRLPMTAPTYDKLTPPKDGTRVAVESGKWTIPNDPIVCLLRGDGIGMDVGGVPGISACAVKVNMVIFRENTEDVYCGIEFQSNSDKAKRLIDFINKEFGYKIIPSSGIGIKPMSPEGSKRLVRMAIKYAIDKKLPSVTLMHKGNIMKFTEGAFKDWGYEVAKAEFRDKVVTEDEVYTRKADPKGKVLIKDR